MLVSGASLVEERPDRLEQLGRPGVRLGRRPPDHRRAGVVRQRVLDLGAQLLRRDDDHLQAARAAQGAIDLVAHRLQVLLHEVVDVARVARLRPAALVVPARGLLGLVDDLDEPARLEPVDGAALTRHDRDEVAVPPELRQERRQAQAGVDPGIVAGRLRERKHLEEPVRRRGEDRQSVRSVPVEVVVPPGADPLEVVAERKPAVPVGGARLGELLRMRDDGVEAAADVGGRRRRRGVEIDVDADRTAVRGPESREAAEQRFRDGGCHVGLSNRLGRI